MFMIDYKELVWWYWFITACLLAAGVSGNHLGFILAISLTMFQLVHFMIRENGIMAYTVQVRFWYLVLLLVALPKPMQIIYWIPTIGTWVRILFGYCIMARCVSLFPWNRNRPFSVDLLVKTFITRPVRGNIMQVLHNK
jgi:hypothetical protein